MALDELEGASVHDGENPDRCVAFDRLVDTHVVDEVAVFVVGPTSLSTDEFVSEVIGRPVMVRDVHGNETWGTLDAVDGISAGLRLRVLLSTD